MTDMDPKDQIKHVDYEYMMAVKLIRIIQDKKFPNFEVEIQNALIESMLIHIRSIAEFHKVKGGPRTGDIERDNIHEWDEFSDNENLRELVTAANQGMAHLTLKRDETKDSGYNISYAVSLFEHHYRWRCSAPFDDAPSITWPLGQAVAATTTAVSEVVATELGRNQPTAEEE